jgi:superfamily II DNA/RNA helicase
VGALHGDMAQSVRFTTLEKFKAGEIRLLVCSDVAARGLDIGGLSHVFNFDVPHHAEDYVHRIGRTGRAGREGHAYTLASPDDRLAVEAIEKLTTGAIPRIAVAGLDVVEWAEGDSRKRRGRGGKPSGKSDSRGRGGKSDDKPARAPREAEAAPAQVAAQPTERAAPAERSRGERGPRPPRNNPRGEQAPRAEQAPRPPRAEPRQDYTPQPEPYRADGGFRGGDRSRERRYPPDDLGPSVTGFGDDVPAFMMLPRRAASHHAHAVHDVGEAA